METMMERLLALQTLLRFGDSTSPAQKQQIEQLRVGIPHPILAHFLRQLTTGRKGVAYVRHGICGECHIRVSQAMVQTLTKIDDLVVCESCGAYLVLAPVTAATEVPGPKRRKAKKVATQKPVVDAEHPESTALAH